ncbi:ABC transporter permease [Halostella pelagica]|uniref:ABC transporter permease n=1 Tax=Halostella pelagica TaxID=2583824 RepID=UPI00108179FB|nr:ABC transporter permease [Halostella pelagica]
MAVETYETSHDGGWASQVHAFTERYLREIARSRVMLAWSVGFPAVFYLLNLALFIDLSTVPDELLGQVKGAVVIGFGTFTTIIVCISVFAQLLVNDIEAGRYEQFRSLPVSPTADLVGRILAGVIVALSAFLVMLGIGVLTGAEYGLRDPASLPLALGAFIAFAVPWLTLGLLLGAVLSDARYATVISTVAALVLYFVTGFNGAEPSMFAADATLLNYLPNTLPNRFLNYHLTTISNWGASGMTPPPVPTGPRWVGLLAAYGAGSFLLALGIMRRLIYKRGVLP